MMLLGQTPPQYPVSGDFWNPTNWAPFVKEVGIPGFFAVVLFGFFVVFIWKALNKWDKHLTRAERLQAMQFGLCRQVHREGGTANISDVRKAGHAVADAILELGMGINPKTGHAVRPFCSAIHEALRNEPAPLPEVVSEVPESDT